MPSRPDPPQLWRSVFYPPAGYRYFALPPDFSSAPSAGWMNILKAAWNIDAAMLAYARSGPDPIPKPGIEKILAAAAFTNLDLLGDWSGGSKGTQAYFASTRDFAILAFRGTERDDWRDIAADLATWPVAEDHENEAPGTANRTLFHQFAARAVVNPAEPAVHRGFQAALNEVWPDAAGKLRDYRARSDNEIFFTGHSLGAALATLAFSRFHDPHSSLYTFGSPRVGNQAFVDRLRARPSLGQVRFIDNHDLVTRVPPGLFSYAHVPGTLFQIVPGQGVVDRTNDPTAGGSDSTELTQDLRTLAELRFPIELDTVPPDDLYDHAPGCYANRIWNRL